MRIVSLVVLAACRVEFGPPAVSAEAPSDVLSGEVWVYTSMYQHVIDRMDPELELAIPGVRVEWLQSGSEKIAQRVEAELAAGGTKACLLLTSDPLWYADLGERDQLLPHLSPHILKVDRGLVDPEGRFAAARLSLMVLAYHPGYLSEAEVPRTFQDLGKPPMRDRFSTPDPLGSGTMFTSLVFLTEDPGWESLKAIQSNGWVASGGSSAVVARMESGERPVGMVLLENVLSARRKGSPISPVYPADGAVLVPGPIALTRGCGAPAAARAVYDFILSPRGQELIREGDMYAALPEVQPPEGARPLAEVVARPWSAALVERHRAARAEVKTRWAALTSGAP